MPIVVDTELYELVKKHADDVYKKPSAYKSGYIVKTYKSLGGRYLDDNEPRNLQKWYAAKWKDVGGMEYPVYRPTVRVDKSTPLLASEIDPKNLKQQVKLKQQLKGTQNLPPFERK